MKSPIKTLLVSINQSNFGSFISFIANFSTELKKHIYKNTFSGIEFFSIFKENHVFNEDNPSQKVVIVEEELDNDIDDNWKLR